MSQSQQIQAAGLGVSTSEVALALPPGCADPGLSVFLSDNDPDVQWILDVYCNIFQSSHLVGRVVTTPGVQGEIPARLVAQANIPGAVGWRVSARGSKPGATAWIALSNGPMVGAEVGVRNPRPRPRTYVGRTPGGPATGARGGVIFPAGATLYSLYGNNVDVPGVGVAATWLQVFNNATGLIGAADVPIFEALIQPGAAFRFDFDLFPQVGDPSYRRGITWAASSTPLQNTAVAGLPFEVTGIYG